VASWFPTMSSALGPVIATTITEAVLHSLD